MSSDEAVGSRCDVVPNGRIINGNPSDTLHEPSPRQSAVMREMKKIDIAQQEATA